MLEKQKRETGRVRALILKGRQEGISTYITARYYWKTIFSLGLQTYILTHEQKATDNIFDIVQRYHRLSKEVVKPKLGRSNTKTMQFDELGSGYKVATAGAKGTGRSSTVQLFHGSEVAFWDNAAEHMAGIGQTVADLDGTEIILETTANGIGNYFHSNWDNAVSGLNSFMPIFIAWYLCDDYRSRGEYKAENDDEIEYQETYKLDNSQMLWRRNKIRDLENDVALFNQEYPASPLLAFYKRDGDSFIPPKYVDAANKTKMEEEGALILGVDPADFGDDETACVLRRGRVVRKPICWKKADPMESAGRIGEIINREKPDAVMVLATGNGSGVWSRLKEMYPNVKIYRVMEGANAINQEIYANKKAEMWGNMRDFLEQGAQLPDDAELSAQLVLLGVKLDSRSRIRIVGKENVRSPDRADALSATFAVRVDIKKGMVERMKKYLIGYNGNPMAA